MKIPLGLMHLDKWSEAVSYRFIVMFEIYAMAFENVTGLSDADYDYSYVNEGGVNDYPILIKTPRSRPVELTFTRGIKIRKISESINSITHAEGLLKNMNNQQKALEGAGSIGFIFILGRDLEIVSVKTFISDGSVEWKLSDLDSMSNSPLVESFKISCRFLI